MVPEINTAENGGVSTDIRGRLTVYLLVTGLSFFFLASKPGAVLGFLSFAVIQAGMIIYLLPRPKKLWFLVPTLLLALSPVVNACPLWRPCNVAVMLALYAGASCGFSLNSQGWGFLGGCVSRIFEPMSCIYLPFRWAAEVEGGRSDSLKRVLKALILAIPAVLILLAVLSGADLIFSHAVGGFFSGVLKSVNVLTLLRLGLSLFIALYLFGCLWLARTEQGAFSSSQPKKADMLVLGILLSSILAVYTVFCVIQFRYLFCGAELPYGLSYTDYARRGFFELLGLSGINIGLILFTIRRRGQGGGAKAAKALCCYLCGVTAVLLVSSFYRMALYCGSDGLTRLRLFVLGFLVFEALGLAATVVYIFKPAFNPGLVYLGLGLIYYLILNLVPVDYFVAKSQVDMFLNGERTELDYAFTLSADAAPQLVRAYDANGDGGRPWSAAHTNLMLDQYFQSLPKSGDWRNFNLSLYRAKKIYGELCSHGE